MPLDPKLQMQQELLNSFAAKYDPTPILAKIAAIKPITSPASTQDATQMLEQGLTRVLPQG